jgi:hypothetical protein
MTMHREDIIDVKADHDNPMVEREFRTGGPGSTDELSPDRKVVIKVLKRENSSGHESVKIQLRTVPFRSDNDSR